MTSVKSSSITPRPIHNEERPASSLTFNKNAIQEFTFKLISQEISGGDLSNLNFFLFNFYKLKATLKQIFFSGVEGTGADNPLPPEVALLIKGYLFLLYK